MAKPINLQAVRESLAALDRIAREHPELLGPSTPDEWEDTLKDLEDVNDDESKDDSRETGRA
jgi:hypothetical protein